MRDYPRPGEVSRIGQFFPFDGYSNGGKQFGTDRSNPIKRLAQETHR
jgi:hypothetical protein